MSNEGAIMDERREKIVTLAHAMIRANGMAETYSRPRDMGISIRVLFAATLFTALASGAMTSMIHEAHRPLTHAERVELDALLLYTAQTKTLDDRALRKDIAQRFGIRNFDDMTESDFSEVKRYLQARAE